MGANNMTLLAEIDDRRAVARRVFDALCAKYPGKYIALIQSRDVAPEPLSAPELSASNPRGRITL
jgi:hypothetical protein